MHSSTQNSRSSIGSTQPGVLSAAPTSRQQDDQTPMSTILTATTTVSVETGLSSPRPSEPVTRRAHHGHHNDRRGYQRLAREHSDSARLAGAERDRPRQAEPNR